MIYIANNFKCVKVKMYIEDLTVYAVIYNVIDKIRHHRAVNI